MWKISAWDDESKTGTVQGPHPGPLPFADGGPYTLGEEVAVTLGRDEHGHRQVVRVEPLSARQPNGTARAVFDAVNDLHLWDWRVESFERGRLTILGSTDFAYYHNAEVVFHEVEFMSCSTSFSHALFRGASDEERERLIENAEWEGQLFTIVSDHGNGSDGLSYFVCAQRAECLLGKIYYYRRENLQPSERIAPWVK